jgi:hypothetical protein
MGKAREESGQKVDGGPHSERLENRKVISGIGPMPD